MKKLTAKKYRFIDYIIIPFAYEPFYCILNIANRLIKAFVPSLQILVTARLIDTVVDVFKQVKPYQDVYYPLASLIIIAVYLYFNSVIMDLLNQRLQMNFQVAFSTEIIRKRASLEYYHVENDDTWNIISRVCENPAGRIFDGFNACMQSVDITIRIVSIMLIIFVNIWWVALIIFSISVPLFILALKSGKVNYAAFKEAKKYERKRDYLSSLITGRGTAEERYLFSFTKKVNENWYSENEKARKSRLKAELKNFIRMKGASLITVAISFFIIGFLLIPLNTGAMTIGLFISLSNQVLSIIHIMSWEFTDLTESITNAREYLKDFTLFCNLSETNQALLPAVPLKSDLVVEKIEFKNVSFRYPGADHYVLKNLSFILSRHKVYAFVGANGAGKTTITKLLTGLYDNYDGEIYINDRNLRDILMPERKALFSIVYQDFAKYYISIREIMNLGSQSELSSQELYKALKAMEIDEVFRESSKGLDQPLGRIRSDGIDMSGGQWQRIAIAHAICKGSPIRILDEPTAALDPIAESDLYHNFKNVTNGDINILITHRLGATKIVDEILLIDNGTVTEKGTHQELMDLKGQYAAMFESQRSWYN